MTQKERYMLMNAPASKKMEDLKGQVATCEKYLIYDKEDKNGEVKEVCSMLIGGDVYSAISPSFIRGLKEFCNIFNPPCPFDFRVIAKASAKGRECILFQAEKWEGSDDTYGA